MTGDPNVIANLITVYQALRSLEEQSHLQEHAFEVVGWKSSKYWDTIENEVHEKCVHFLLNRIFELGGRPVAGYGFDVVYWPDDFGAAIQETISALQRVRAAYGALCDAAEADDDYVTIKMAWKHEKWIEKQIIIMEGLMVRFGKLGTVTMTGVV